MHYYKRNIGDYAKKAARLTILQHGVYNLLIDACYDRERFPTKDEAIDWVWASTVDEVQAVEFVLRKFFSLDEQTGVYVQPRIAEEIAEYHEFCGGQAANGKKGGRPKKANPSEKKPNGFSEEPDENPDETDRAQNETLTTNQEPLTTNQVTCVAMFNELWTSWPKGLGEKGSRKAAERVFTKLKPSAELFASMLRALDVQTKDKLAKAATGQFTPPFKHVERWLRDRRWEDEISTDLLATKRTTTNRPSIFENLNDRAWAD